MAIWVRFDDESQESIDVTEVTPGRFRLEGTPLSALEPIWAGDVIEAKALRDGTYQFRRVAQRAPTRHFSWCVAQSFVESPRYWAFGATVEAAGGSWEGLMGGVLLVHLPIESAFDAEGELERYMASDPRDA